MVDYSLLEIDRKSAHLGCIVASNRSFCFGISRPLSGGQAAMSDDVLFRAVTSGKIGCQGIRLGGDVGRKGPPRVVDHIVDYLAATGVEHIFGVDGDNLEDLYDAADFRSDIAAVLAKHEFSAATMADGYSPSGAGLGGVASTSGGGGLNLVPGLG